MAAYKGNDVEYENLSQSLILQDSDFIKSCWNTVAPLSFELFYTINLNGKVTEVAWFPNEINANCIKTKLLSTNFPKPKSIFYGWWLVWDGSGG